MKLSQSMNIKVFMFIKLVAIPLTGVAQWARHSPANGLHRWFNSQSGHVAGLQARSLVGGMQETSYQCFSHKSMFLSLFFSFPSL